MNEIADYLRELSGQLRRSRRRRILTEVRAHLIEAAAADPRFGVDPAGAARRAVQRFGAPERVASQFNTLPSRPRALLQRVAALALASAAMASLGTATVWAFEPGAASHSDLAHHQQAQPIAGHR